MCERCQGGARLLSLSSCLVSPPPPRPLQSAGVDWPIDRLQINPWPAWQAMAAHAGYGYVWMPMGEGRGREGEGGAARPHWLILLPTLSPSAADARARFNVTKAWAYVNSTLGYNYGACARGSARAQLESRL